MALPGPSGPRPSLALALALALALVGCVKAPDVEPTPPRTEGESANASLRAIEETFSGSVSGTPAAPGVQEYVLEVPTGAIGVNGTLSWTSPAARLSFQLVDPAGEVVSNGRNNGDNTMTVVTEDPMPKSGKWKYRVVSTIPLPVDFTLAAVAELVVPQDNSVIKTVTVGTFYEVNLIMEGNASFTFSFNATQPVKWDVHSHPGNEVKYWHQDEGKTGFIEFMAPERGIYSVLFENSNPAIRADVAFELIGAFRMHSHAQ